MYVILKYKNANNNGLIVFRKNGRKSLQVQTIRARDGRWRQHITIHY